MKRIYLQIYNFVWFWISKHCNNMFSHNYSMSSGQSELIWLEELGSVIEYELEKSKKKHCFLHLCKIYIFAFKSRNSVRNEGKLRTAQESYAELAQRIKLGKYLLMALLTVNALLGLWVTFNYQVIDGSFSFTNSVIAIITYGVIAWSVFEARASLIFKLTLISVISLTSLNAFLWPLWQDISSSCYNEICALLNPNGLFQNLEVKIPILIFWFSFLLVMSFKTPISDYLTYRKSLNRLL